MTYVILISLILICGLWRPLMETIALLEVAKAAFITECLS